MEQAIKKFGVKGKIHFWEFKEKNPNLKHWNFTADNEGCTSFIELLALMQSSPYSSSKNLILTPPTKPQIEVPNNRNIAWRTNSRLKLNFKQNETTLWNIKVEDDQLEIDFSVDKLNEFINAVAQVKAGKGDFAIADAKDENILYFWWYQ
jgi:hypothetical protein